MTPERTNRSPDEPARIKRIVVKIGTSTLCNAKGSPDADYLASLAAQIAAERSRDVECVVVSSGAIRAGLDRLTLPRLPKSTPLKQAAAAVGQGRLMQLYGEAFAPHSTEVAQVLLTRDDFYERRRYLHAANTLRALLRLSVVPVVNENDTVAVDEIKVGDNDTLAAQVAAMIDADLLILLSDIDGLFTADPNADPSATLVRTVSSINAVAGAVAASRGAFGTGGMRTKLEAARIATRCGIRMVIAHGRRANVIAEVTEGRTGTLFLPAAQRLSARKRWLAGSKIACGAVTIHAQAAAQVIRYGKSLLAAGVLDVHGQFKAGDMVALQDTAGDTFAQGIVTCGVDRLRDIKGLRSEQIAPETGYATEYEVVHRDNLVLMNSA